MRLPNKQLSNSKASAILLALLLVLMALSIAFLWLLDWLLRLPNGEGDVPLALLSVLTIGAVVVGLLFLRRINDRLRARRKSRA